MHRLIRGVLCCEYAGRAICCVQSKPLASGEAKTAGGGATHDSITLTIDGETIGTRDLTRAIAELADLLGDLEAELSPDAGRGPRWEIAGVSRPDPARVVTNLRPVANAPDGGSETAAVWVCIAGVRALGERPARPPAFSDEALKRVLRLASLMKDVAGMEIAGVEQSGTQERAIVTPRAAANAAAALEQGETRAYEVYGSVEGPAEALDVRGEPYFTVRDAISGGAVRCYFGDGEREEVALAVSGKRIVSVGGILHRDQAGRPQRISPVRSFAVIDEPLPGEWVSPAGLFAGIGDTQEYLRSIRGE